MTGTRSSLLCLALAAAATPHSGNAQQSPLHPHSMYEPPAAGAAASLAASSANVPADLLTTGERTRWQQTGLYAEAVELMRRMEQRSPLVRVIQFGTTAQGRPMYAMVISSD